MLQDFKPRLAGMDWKVLDVSITPTVPDIDRLLYRPLELFEDEIAAYSASPEAPVAGQGPPVSIGIDSEWTYDPESNRNRVLSYQAYVVSDLGSLSVIVYPRAPTQRLSFEKFLGALVHAALRYGLIDAWPRVALVYAHFLRADLTHFASFWEAMKHEIDGLRGTLTSLKGDFVVDVEAAPSRPYRPKPLVLKDGWRRPRRTYVRFIDTQLLMPGGLALAQAGELINLPKLELPDGYHISRMDRLLAERPEEFEAYALRDAELAYRLGERYRSVVRSLGLSGCPPTLGTLAVRYFLHLMRQSAGAEGFTARYERLFGLEREVSEVSWHEQRQRPVARRERRLTVHRVLPEAFITRHYHGGNNQCFVCGPSEVGCWFDLDLKSAYVTGLLSLYALDYAQAVLSRDVADFLEPVCGFAQVRFRFPDSVRFPCLPVRAGSRGLYFPLTGESYCTAPELALAVRLGADIELIQGVVVPWQPGEERIFEPFVREVIRRRLEAKASGDVFMEKFIKEVGNSLYGKLAQGTVEKTHFDPRTGGRKKTSTSAITHPSLAAHITGFIRAVTFELLAGVPPQRTVISVTTDGFLTNAPLEELDYSGPLMRDYQALVARVDDSARDHPFAGLECKHRAAQVVSMRTRGLITALTLDGSPPILAKASVKPPMRDRTAQNAYMLDLYLNRVPGQKHDQEHLISTSEQWQTESDLVSIQRSLTLNLEYDFKRQPVRPRMVSVAGVEHLAFDTRPWTTVEEGLQARAWFDGWRRTRTLKTLADWDDWQAFYESRSVRRGKGIRVTSGGDVGLLRRLFLRAYTREVWGASRTLPYAALAQTLTERGYPTTLDEVKNAKRGALVEQAVVSTPPVMALWAVLLDLQPDLVAERFFAPESLRAQDGA